VLAFVTDPIVGGPALVEAIDIAVAFYSTNPPTLPHITFDSVDPLPNQSSVRVGHQSPESARCRRLGADGGVTRHAQPSP
jgi:hypothetical protein